MKRLDITLLVGMSINTFLLTAYLVIFLEGVGIDWFVIGLLYLSSVYYAMRFETSKIKKEKLK